MQLFRPWYERALRWSAHPKAPWFLTGLSFIEAIFFPIPPEVMLAPMSLAQPKRAFWFASLSLVDQLAHTISSPPAAYLLFTIGMALLLFEFELSAQLFGVPGDWDRALRMLRAGVRFGHVDAIVCDYYPTTLWGRDGA